MKGSVKMFNSQKGYGFITPDGESKDLFVHYTGINGNGYRSLEQGQRVEFDIVDGKPGKGPMAANVEIIN